MDVDEDDDARESDRKRCKKDHKDNVKREWERSSSRSDRHRDDGVERLITKSDEDYSVKKERKQTCEVVEEELRGSTEELDEEMEKRRTRPLVMHYHFLVALNNTDIKLYK